MNDKHLYKDASGNVYGINSDGSQIEHVNLLGLTMLSDKETSEYHSDSSPSKSDILESFKIEMRAIRKDILDAVNGIGFRALVSGNEALSMEVASVSMMLLDITDDAALNSSSTYDSMRASGIAAFNRISEESSESIKIAFRHVPIQ